jgi:outer membrane protein assembly factor BamB
MRYLTVSPAILLIFLILITGCASFKLDEPIGSSENDWLLGGGSSARTHFRETQLSPPLMPDWNYHAGGGFSTNALLVKGTVLFLTTLHGELHLIDTETGKKIGRVNLNEPISGSPVLFDHIIVVPLAAGDRTLIAYDLLAGKRIWSKDIGPIESSLLLYRNILFAASRNGTLYAVDPHTGEEFWRRNFDTFIYSAPSAADEMLYIATSEGLAFALDYKSGDPRWESDTMRTILTSPVVGSERIYIAARDSVMYCLNKATGELVWSRNLGARIFGAPSVGSTYLITGTAGGDLIALSPENGTEAWRFRAKAVVNSPPLIAGNFVYFVSLDKHVYVLDEHSGILHWSYDTSSRLKTTPIIVRDRLIICAENRRVYAFRRDVLERVIKYIPNSEYHH